MALKTFLNGNREVIVEIVTPTAQASTDSEVAISGSAIDATCWRSVAYTIKVATKAIDWAVYGANASDFSDAVAVLSPAEVAAAAVSSYAVAQAPYRYYRVTIKSHDSGQAGTATVVGIAKG